MSAMDVPADPTAVAAAAKARGAKTAMDISSLAPATFDYAHDNQQASEKADEFIAALEEAGLTAPSKDHGATGPGSRPILGDTARLLRGQLIAIEIHCPDELEEFKEYVEDLESEDVAEG